MLLFLLLCYGEEVEILVIDDADDVFVVSTGTSKVLLDGECVWVSNEEEQK